MPASDAAIAPDSVRLVERAIALAAFRGERMLSVARALFCLAVLARAMSFAGEPGAPAHLVLSGPSMVLAIAFSTYMVGWGWRRHEDEWLLTASSIVDALVCFAALVPNSLWPGAAYGGILRVPDTAALLIVTAVSGIRLVPRAAVWAAILNAASLGVLVAIDVSRLRIVYPDDAGQLSLFVIYLGAAIAIAVLVAVRTRRLVAAGAEQAVRAEQVRHKLHELLQDHHDVRTVLSSAMLNADLAVRAVGQRSDEATTPAVRERLEQVREDLRQVARFVATVRDEAQEELRFERERVSVDASVVMAAVVASVGPQFRDVHLSVERTVDRATVATGGGARTLERVLQNLIINACQGNGAAAATEVRLRVEPGERPGWLRFSIIDNGPGFPAAVLPLCGERAVTTKTGGTGIGLVLTAGLLRANGSQLECVNATRGGGIARFELPHVGLPGSDVHGGPGDVPAGVVAPGSR